MSESKEEQISLSDEYAEATDTNSSVPATNAPNELMQANLTNVIITGWARYKLIPIYKHTTTGEKDITNFKRSYFIKNYTAENYISRHFMPGIDLLNGYNLINIAHYDMNTQKSILFFKNNVLVKNLYYPSFTQDSIDNKPVNRDYYLVSVYDSDTNKDTVINKKDLRTLYHFDLPATKSTRLIPEGFSVVRSQYDRKSDVMYVFAREDKNRNGQIDNEEPISIFGIDLKNPMPAFKVF
ncbi:MAG: hypothetical protein NZ529_05790 [Cytophagaceae bacterium]|nr:hypothetical protein [Cytophagaceae bacterium]MDW8456289.1 hypothetical protein [Cytophagaceae bacterium]